MSLGVPQLYSSLLLVFSAFVLVCQTKDLSSSSSSSWSSSRNQISSEASSPSSAVVKLSSVSGVIVDAPKDGFSKRDIKVADLSGAGSGAITAKSYDPPPEFYRGPGSTSASVSPASASSSATANLYNSNNNNNNNNRDSATAGFISKPITFPGIGDSRNKYGVTDNNGQYLANSFNNWQQLKGSAAGLNGGAYNSNHIQDRISVGHYGSSAGHSTNSGTSGYTSSSSSSHGGGGGGSATYAYEGHHPSYYGGHYIGSGHGGGGGYYGSSSAEGIPFDVYGSKGGSSAGVGHYAGAGGEYSYTYPDLHAELPTHKGPPHGGGNSHELSSKALLAKSFLIPLASAAVLGIAAALVSNPLLLQLGTVSGVAAPTLIGKRKRRDLATGESVSLVEMVTPKELPKANEIAYRGQRRRQRRLTRV